MTIASDTIALIDHIAKRIPDLPPVRDFLFSAAEPATRQSSNFAVMILADGTIGLTYVALDNILTDLQTNAQWRDAIGRPPQEVAKRYASEHAAQRALGLAAINCISQYVIRQSGHTLSTIDSSTDLLTIEAGDHIGMIGYFPSMVEKVRQFHIPLTVVELDKKWVQQEHNFEVTTDYTQLANCNKIVCTGTTQVNATLERVLPYCQHAKEVFLVGPTASCLPDVLFRHGVTAIGGAQIVDSRRFVALWSNQQRWQRTTNRYVIRKSDYPGAESLIDLSIKTEK